MTHAQYDTIERAIVDGTRIVIGHRGRRQHVVIPLRLRVVAGREAIDARNPTTGHEMIILLDDVDTVEVVR